VLAAVSDGTILVLDGWMMGRSWTPRRFATKGGAAGASADHHRESTGEAGLARRAMGGRGEEVAFEGARYVLLPASSWRELREQGGYEVVRHGEAVAILQRMATRASSADQKAALGEAANALANTTRTFVREGLFLVRQSASASFSAKTETAAVVTPSQVAKQIKQAELVENVDPVMEGGTVELDLSEVELPVDSDAEATEASEDESAPGDPEASEPGGEPETPEPSDDSSDQGPQ